VHEVNSYPGAAGNAVRSTAVPADQASPDARHLVMRHTLSIMTAETEEQLVGRTLAAACELTHAAVAAAIDHDSGCRAYGDEELRERLAVTDAGVRRELRRPPGGMTRALAGIGLPTAITASLGETVIIVADPAPGRLGPEAGSLLALLVAHALACRDRLQQLDQLRIRANCDPLTGLRHHRPFDERLAATAPGSTAVIALDVDGFKKINDEYGHQAGDEALLALVGALRAALRGDDELYRIGGDEFAVVVDVNGRDEVVAIAQRVMDAARRVGHTVSIGAAVHGRGETGRETLCRADQALYEAKRAGRDTARIAA
jgi:diguanylate cyclase (GGDEF)-like protein